MQPKKGRSKGGGIRFGYMEANAAMSTGASVFLRERLRDSSDLVIVVMCKNVRSHCQFQPFWDFLPPVSGEGIGELPERQASLLLLLLRMMLRVCALT